jgi:hypothetical protein
MAYTRWFRAFGLALIALIFSLTVAAQFGFSKKNKAGGDAAGQVPSADAVAIQDKLLSRFKLTKTTADRTDIVVAGDIVVLHKDGLTMNSTTCTYPFSNVYDNGNLTANSQANNGALAKSVAMSAATSFFKSKIGMGSGGSATASAADAAKASICTTRKFVDGEKFWVTGVTAQRDAIVISIFSDPYSDVRFYGEIRITFPVSTGTVPPSTPTPDGDKAKKGNQGVATNLPLQRVVPPVDDFEKTVAEVITLQPGEVEGDQAASDAAPAPDSGAMTDIAPPPPPADVPPPTIELNQTKEQVIAGFGQPTRIAKLGVKEIYYYKDMKVTFTNGKVSNIQ